MACRRIVLALAAAFVLGACASPGGFHPAPSPSTVAHFRLAWQARAGAAVDGRPAVAGGLAIVATAGGRLIAYGLERGAQVWSDSGLGPLQDSPEVAGSAVFVGSLSSRVYSFGLADGRQRWSWSGPTPTAAIWSSPMPWQGLVLVGVASQAGDHPLEAGRLVALDQADGHEVWDLCTLPGCAAGGGVWSSAVVDMAGRAFVGVGNPHDSVLAIDAATGRRLWETPFHPDQDRDLDVGATPLVVNVGGRETIAAGSTAGDFKLLDADTGKVVWSRQVVAGSAVHGLIGSPATDGSRLYVGSASPPTGLYALTVDGAIAWRRPTPFAVYSSPVVANGLVVFGAGEVFGNQKPGDLLAVAADDGRLLWSTRTGAAVLGSPAFAGSGFVIGDSAGIVRSFAT